MKKRLFSLTLAFLFLFCSLFPQESARAGAASQTVYGSDGSPADGSPADGNSANGNSADGSSVDNSSANGNSADGSSADGGTTDDEYEEGTVLVTLAAPDKTSLTKKGKASFDSQISIEESYDFGEAGALASTDAQQEFLSDKTLYISEVSSDVYSTEELMQKLERNAYVLQVEPDYEQHLSSISNDPYEKEQWHLDGGGSFSGSSTGISFSAAQGKTKTGTPVVAVMDTGIDYDHEDLAGHMWVNSDITLPGIHGYDFTDGTPDCRDSLGHGTHCAGTIAAVSGNEKGIIGISDARLMALKIFDDEGKTSNSTIVKAMNYIVQAKTAGVNIVAVNCSWGGGNSGSTLPALIDRIGKMGVLFIFASGNEGTNHDRMLPLSCPYDLYAGGYGENRNYIITTGSSDTNDRPSDFSDYGKKDVDLFAPGENILSTYPEEVYSPGIYPAKTETQLTASFLPFDDDTDTKRLYTESELGLSTISSTTTRDTSFDFRSNPGSGSLTWTIDFGKPTFHNSKLTYLYLDVTDLHLDMSDTYYVSMYLGTTDSDGLFSWDHINKRSKGNVGDDSNRFYKTPDGRTYFKIIGLEVDGMVTETRTYRLDDIGISVADPDVSLFGKYDTASGTSMAAPMVAGAVGLLAEIYPDDSAKNRRQRLLTCTRYVSEIAEKCATGGVLDLRKMDTYVPVADTPVSLVPPSTSTPTEKPRTVSKKTAVKKITVKGSKKTLKAGKKRKLKAVVSPSNATNKKVKWKSSKKKWATVSKKGVVTAKKKGRGHTVKITATATDGSGKKGGIRFKIG